MNYDDKIWTGFDFDGTLCTIDIEKTKSSNYDFYSVGEPIPEMIEKVKQYISEGKRVKIFTARVAPETLIWFNTSRLKTLHIIHKWCEKHIGVKLEITHEKDMFMKELYDDITLFQVERNTGKLL